MSGENDAFENAKLGPEPRSVLFARMPDTGLTVGVVSRAEPSTLALLAAGVAGMAARRARRERMRKK